MLLRVPKIFFFFLVHVGPQRGTKTTANRDNLIPKSKGKDEDKKTDALEEIQQGIEEKESCHVFSGSRVSIHNLQRNIAAYH